MGEGELDGGHKPLVLSDRQKGWLDTIESEVEEFLYGDDAGQ